MYVFDIFCLKSQHSWHRGNHDAVGTRPAKQARATRILLILAAQCQKQTFFATTYLPTKETQTSKRPTSPSCKNRSQQHCLNTPGCKCPTVELNDFISIRASRVLAHPGNLPTAASHGTWSLSPTHPRRVTTDTSTNDRITTVAWIWSAPLQEHGYPTTSHIVQCL